MAKYDDYNSNKNYFNEAIPEVKIRHRPWKVPFSPKITTPDVGLYSLFDLFYYEQENYIYRRYNGIDSKGLRLEHDIICYNSSIYGGGTIVDRSKNTYTDWSLMGFDIGAVYFDPRAKYRIISVPVEAGTEQNPRTEYIDYKIYDKDAALSPQTVYEMVEYSKTFLQKGDDDAVDNSIWAQVKYKPFSVGVASDALTNSAQIILSSPDTVFSNTLIGKEGYSAYNSLCLNITNNDLVNDILYSVTAKSILNTLPDELARALEGNDYLSLRKVDQGSIAGRVTLPEQIIDLLKHTYVWLRCSFFGDYVNPDSFNQDLNQTANVRHGNIMVSAQGDFNRYDDATPLIRDTKLYTEEYLSTKTRPYLPQTAPSEDILSKQIAENASSMLNTTNSLSTYGESQDIDAISQNIEDIQKVAERDDNPFIGSLWNDILSADTDNNAAPLDNARYLTPPMYYDSEADKNYRAENHVPVLLPKTGSIQTDGRIISPTIDEIWIYFKKLVSGHASDTINNEIEEGAEKDVGLIVNQGPRANDKDTRLQEGAELNWDIVLNENNELSTWKRGDPIEISIASEDDTTGAHERLEIKNWVAVPETFKMVVFDYLQKVSAKATTFENDGKDSPYYLEGANNEVDKGSHDILNETAKNANNEFIKNKELVSNEFQYGPRANPYSLRELEAALKNVKFNLNSLMQYLFTNYTVNSQLVKRTNQGENTEENPVDYTNRQASGLYQFHRDYNSEVDNPNTWFNKNVDENAHTNITPETGASAVFDDSGLNSYKLHNDVKLYGRAETLPETTEDYSSSDVYLAADGTWRYIFDHVRVPVLKTDY